MTLQGIFKIHLVHYSLSKVFLIVILFAFREELQQCLNIIVGCLSGAAILLPDWERPPLENM